jgi:repressor of nif and glnA expression
MFNFAVFYYLVLRKDSDSYVSTVIKERSSFKKSLSSIRDIFIKNPNYSTTLLTEDREAELNRCSEENKLDNLSLKTIEEQSYNSSFVLQS